jgi:hypothetical protein
VGDHEPSDAAEDGQQHALREQLAEETCTAHAEGEAQRNLTSTLQRARQQQVRDVGARDEEHDDRHTADPRRDLGHARCVRPALVKDRPDHARGRMRESGSVRDLLECVAARGSDGNAVGEIGVRRGRRDAGLATHHGRHPAPTVVSHQFLESRALIPMVGAYEVSDM